MSTLEMFLKQKQELLNKKTAFVGFDGFLDRIIYPIQKREAQSCTYFETIEEFGQFLIEKKEKSCSIELDIQKTKIGGNMPIFSSAFGGFGIHTHCMGMLGDSKIEPLFLQMPSNCILHSYRETVYSDCFEFKDGKIMFASSCNLDKPWEKVKEAMSDIENYLQKCDIAAMLNWSELLYANNLWNDIYEFCFAEKTIDFQKQIFFDLCDCSRKNKTQIQEVFMLIKKFSKFRKTILSLNENEAYIVGKSLFSISDSLEEIAKHLSKNYQIDQVVIHTIYHSYVWTQNTWYHLPTFFCENPVLSTGAGDNFNAGYCLGSILGCSALECLLIANYTASFYIQNGVSITYTQLTELLSKNPNFS